MLAKTETLLYRQGESRDCIALATADRPSVSEKVAVGSHAQHSHIHNLPVTAFIMPPL